MNLVKIDNQSKKWVSQLFNLNNSVRTTNRIIYMLRKINNNRSILKSSDKCALIDGNGVNN